MRKRRLTLINVVIISLLCVALAPALSGEVRLPAVVGDHMVIQQGMPVAIWGFAAKDEQVVVRLGDQEQKAQASADGKWRVVFEPLKAGGPALEMTVRGEKGPDIAVKDILVGEVWLCSGQSNMEWAMEWLAYTAPDIMKADHPRLRLFHVPKHTSDRPKDDVDAKWALCAPASVRAFSAVAYYYGLELHKRLGGVPVGLIESAWGGTDIEPWTPPEGFAAVPETKPLLAKQLAKYEDYRKELETALPAWEAWIHGVQKALKAKTEIPLQPANGEFPSDPYDNPQAPTTLYNAMIHALTPFAIRGAIWYQGENNRNDGLSYEKKMEALIRGWREVWRIGDFPFYYVEIAPFNYGYDKNMKGSPVPDIYRLPLLWEAQTNALRLPNTGMVVVTDITNLGDIHPADKRDVGERLALWARAKTYGEKDLVYSGPMFKSMSVEGDKARIAFDHVGGGLVTNDGQAPTWFEVAGDDHVFYRAEAEISGDTVVISSGKVAAPKAVRFGWSQLAVPNLANKEGLPASPFRTDRW
jgi:sialate O-acetylesterase